jgi:hypothetical protein
MYNKVIEQTRNYCNFSHMHTQQHTNTRTHMFNFVTPGAGSNLTAGIKFEQIW